MTPASTIDEVNHVYATGRTRSVTWRLSQLAALQRMLEDHTEAIETALRQDLGKNSFEAWVSEIGQVLTEIKWLRKHAAAWAKPQRVRTPLALWPAKSMIQHEPRGTVVVISPWNYPVLLALSPLAGCSTVSTLLSVATEEEDGEERVAQPLLSNNAMRAAGTNALRTLNVRYMVNYKAAKGANWYGWPGTRGAGDCRKMD